MSSTTLQLSKTSAHCHSTWTGTYNIGGSFTYSTPTTDSDNIYVTVPAALVGATFTSASVKYNSSMTKSGTCWVQFSDTRENVSNTSLLRRLQNGDTSISILLMFRAIGGTGGRGNFSADAYWDNFSITVTYLAASGITNSVTVTSCGNATYSLDVASLSENETAVLSLFAQPSKNINAIRVNLCPNTLTEEVFGYSVAKSIPANSSGSVSFSVAIPQSTITAMQNRVYTAQIQIIFCGSNGTEYSSEWVDCKNEADDKLFRLVKSRVAPVISAVSWSENGTEHLSDYGNLIQHQTVPVLCFSVALDTTADTAISIGSREITVDGKTYSPGENSCMLSVIAASGNVAFTIAITDSYGQTGTYSGTVIVLSYTAPAITGLDINRYTSSLDSGGNTVYELDDDGTHLWFDGSIIVQTALGSGSNPWSLHINGVAVVDESTTAETVYSHERSLLTSEYDNTEAHDFTVTLSDQFTTRTYEVNVPKAGGYLNIETTGVAIGMRSTGTTANPLFQVAYPAELESISKLNGRVYDTGWVQFHVNSDFAEQSSLYKRRIGNIVFLTGALRYTPSLAQNGYAVMVNDIGEGYKPTLNMSMIPLGGDYPGFLLYVGTDGKLQIRNRNGSARANMYFTVCCSYAI